MHRPSKKICKSDMDMTISKSNHLSNEPANFVHNDTSINDVMTPSNNNFLYVQSDFWTCCMNPGPVALNSYPLTEFSGCSLFNILK